MKHNTIAVVSSHYILGSFRSILKYNYTTMDNRINGNTQLFSV